MEDNKIDKPMLFDEDESITEESNQTDEIDDS